MQSEILEKAELHVIGKITNEFSDRIVFHEIGHQYRVVEAANSISLSEDQTDDQKTIILLAAWLSNLGLSELSEFTPSESYIDFLQKIYKHSIKLADSFLIQINFSPVGKAQVLGLIEEMNPYNTDELSSCTDSF